MFAPKAAKPATKEPASSKSSSLGLHATPAAPPVLNRSEEDADAASPSPKPRAAWDLSRIPLFPLARSNRSKALSQHASAPATNEIQREEGAESLEADNDRAAEQTGVSKMLGSAGEPLDPAARHSFESRFGHDLSKVRIHADSRAAESADKLGAHAYTYGSDIVFAAGKYAPHTASGRRLLLHELTHVSQQRHARPTGEHGKTSRAEVSELEAQAEAVARSSPFAASLPFPLRSVATPVVLRQEAHGTEDTQTGARQPRTRKVEEAIALLNDAKGFALANPPNEERALAILDDVLRFFHQIGDDLNIHNRLTAHGGLNVGYATILIGRATGAVQALGARIRIGEHPSASTWDYELREVATAKEYLQIVAGDIEASESAVVAGVEAAFDWSLEAARTVVELTPIIGSLIMVGEAIAGTSITGKKLSTGQRALLGFGALLSEVGSIIKAGQVAVAASRLSTVAKLSMQESLRLCIVSRALTDAERGLLKTYAENLAKGIQLTDEQVVRMNRLLGKLSEADRALGVRNKLAAETGAASQAGRFTNLDTTAASVKTASEKAMGEALAKQLGADVVRLAPDVAKAGGKNPDFLINNVVAEFVELGTTSGAKSPIENALTKIIDKHRQAGIVIVELKGSVVSAAEVLGSMDRLWGNPRYADVVQTIVVKGEQIIKVVDRPVSIAGPAASVAARGAAKVGERALEPDQPDEPDQR
jgi:Domain of unknown function (DUF4157)/Pre-toxin TG/Contact-dependent growth inhibition CdiA C-terminal domain